jgi:hypothetical protein
MDQSASYVHGETRLFCLRCNGIFSLDIVCIQKCSWQHKIIIVGAKMQLCSFQISDTTFLFDHFA